MIALLLILFGIAAYLDWKKHSVPDFIPVLLWLWIALFGDAHLAAYVFAAMFFSALLVRDLFGWADVLAAPAYACAFLQLGFYPLGYLGFFLPLIISSLYKGRKEIPCFPFYFCALALAFALSLCLRSHP